MTSKLVKGILAALLCAALMTGCVAVGDKPSPETATVTSADHAGAASSAPAAVPEGTQRDFQMRVFENGSLLFSTWPNEGGSLQKGPNLANATPQHINASRKLPSILEPLREFWLNAPAGSTVELVNFSVPSPVTETIVLPPVLYLRSNGTLTEGEMRGFLGTHPEPGLMLFAKRIPIEITRIDNTTLHYRVALPNETNFSVPRTSGLQMDYRLLPNGTGAFRFEVPNGTFDSVGCTPIPGTTIPPGKYVVDSTDADGIHATRYGDAYEYLLQNRIVTMTFEFVNER